MQQFRGLAARAPYFANGSAETLRDLVDFYDRRFNIGYTESGTRGPDQLPERAMTIDSTRAPRCRASRCSRPSSTSAAPEPHRNFVACPIVRDTSTVPCWLAEYKGELYFLTLQTDVSAPVNPPQLGHQVLVEGVVSDEPRICGGIVAEAGRAVGAARAGQLLQRPMLPAEDRYNLTFEPPRPPGPSKGRLAFDIGHAGPAPAPAAEAGPRDVRAAVRLRRADRVPPRRVSCSRSRSSRRRARPRASRSPPTAPRRCCRTTRLFTEREDIGRRRAEQVASLLKDAGLTSLAYDVRWQDAPRPDGVNDAALRRADVVVRR